MKQDPCPKGMTMCADCGLTCRQRALYFCKDNKSCKYKTEMYCRANRVCDFKSEVK